MSCRGLRIALITGRRAQAFIKSVAEELARRTGWKVDIVVAPTEIAALMSIDVVKEVVKNLNCKYDMVILPGTIPFDVQDVEHQECTIVVKGPPDPTDLLLLAELGCEALQKLKEAGAVTPELVIDKWLEELKEHHESTPSLHVCGVRIPERPPPVVIAAEIYVSPGTTPGDAAERVDSALTSGADIAVVGFPAGMDESRIMEYLSAINSRAGYVAIDTPNKRAAAKAASEGKACMVLSAGENDPLLQILPKGTPVVVIPVHRDYSLPSSLNERIRLLERIVEEARRRGLVPIADPLVDPPGFGFARSVAAYIIASERIRAPLLAGIANVYELIDADSHGQIAVLTQLFAEAGASIMLVTEESRKTVRAIAEAAIAATMTGISLLKKRPPKDMGISLLYAKEKREKPGVPPPRKVDKVYDASVLASWYGFKMDPIGAHLIRVEDGYIKDFYQGKRGSIEVRGASAEEVYKAAAFLGLASEPTHFAYLGCELCKAEIALRMGISYVQERPLLVHPADNARVYSARLMKTIRLPARQAGV